MLVNRHEEIQKNWKELNLDLKIENFKQRIEEIEFRVREFERSNKKDWSNTWLI